jgi:ribosomal protein L3 glutamine methyltransferase
MNATPFERRVPCLNTGTPPSQLTTVRDLMRWTVTQLQAHQVALGHGTQDVWDEAAWLVLWSLHIPPEHLDPCLDAHVLPEEVQQTLTLIEQRCQSRRPTAYLTGEAWLRGERFKSDERALVPRSPIAEILDSETLAAWFPDPETPATILDLCTGGGSLAILACKNFAHAHVTASDVSAEALALASENIVLHDLEDRISVYQGDLWEPLAQKRFDLILCNPPYVNNASMSTLPPEYRTEPVHALAGGVDGMDIVRRILAGAKHHLQPGGILVLEIGHEASHFEAAFPELEFIWLPVHAGEQHIVLIEQSALTS